MFPTYTSLNILETASHVRFNSIQFNIMGLEIFKPDSYYS